MSREIGVTHSGHVATIEIRRPPWNYFDLELVRDIADALAELDRETSIRAVVLAAQGKAFCAGADFGAGANAREPGLDVKRLYGEAVQIFESRKPIVAAVHGAAIGGGLGLAMTADLRVTCPEARFSANFTSLGFHPGFGLTVTLPEAIGSTWAGLMFYTSRRVSGAEAVAMNLAQTLVPLEEVRGAAFALAEEIARCSPLGLLSTRAAVRAGLADRVRAATERELAEQNRLRQTEDFKEGVRAVTERRPANFVGR